MEYFISATTNFYCKSQTSFVSLFLFSAAFNHEGCSSTQTKKILWWVSDKGWVDASCSERRRIKPHSRACWGVVRGGQGVQSCQCYSLILETNVHRQNRKLRICILFFSFNLLGGDGNDIRNEDDDGVKGGRHWCHQQATLLFHERSRLIIFQMTAKKMKIYEFTTAMLTSVHSSVSVSTFTLISLSTSFLTSHSLALSLIFIQFPFAIFITLLHIFSSRSFYSASTFFAFANAL